MQFESNSLAETKMNVDESNNNLAVKDVRIENKMGLHARPAMQLAELANKFDSDITIRKDNQSVNAKSIMEVLLLAATQGTNLQIEAKGSDAKDAVEALSKLIEKDKFGEE